MGTQRGWSRAQLHGVPFSIAVAPGDGPYCPGSNSTSSCAVRHTGRANARTSAARRPACGSRPACLACGADRRTRAPTRSLSRSERFGYAKYTGVTN
eukprot:3593565-Prymnesium_polylepis.1